MSRSFLSMLGLTSAVTLIANEKLEGSPLITPTVDAQGRAKTDLEGNPLGTIRFQQEVGSVTGSFFNSRPRVAFLAGTIDNLQRIITANKLKAGSEVAGRIRRVESLKPMFPGHNQKINPSTGEIVSVSYNGNDYPVYMRDLYTEDATKEDTLIREAKDVYQWLMNNETVVTTPQVEEGAGIPQA